LITRRLTVVSHRLAFDNERVIDPLVGERVRKLRERRGWKQKDLAKHAGVAANTVGGLENGRQTRWAKFEQIARALGTTPDAIQRGEGITDDNPLLKTLNDEDLRIGKYHHDAETPIRFLVERILRLGSNDPMVQLWMRIENLDEGRRETLLRSLEQHERALQNERVTTNNKPKQP
jgi:transcriptional regulator with XRE-family HTH domain